MERVRYYEWRMLNYHLIWQIPRIWHIQIITLVTLATTTFSSCREQFYCKTFTDSYQNWLIPKCNLANSIAYMMPWFRLTQLCKYIVNQHLNYCDSLRVCMLEIIYLITNNPCFETLLRRQKKGNLIRQSRIATPYGCNEKKMMV